MNEPYTPDADLHASTEGPGKLNTHALFAGDDGDLDAAGRKALVVLLKNRFITRGSHPEEYKALTRWARQIRSRLHDMFLDLALDTEREVAYKFQVAPEGSDRFPTLLHATEWGREETILLVHLRSLAHAAHASGDLRVFVDRDDLLEHVAGMRPPTATNKDLDRGRTRNALETLCSAGILIGRRDADRWEISRAIDLLLPLETLQQLLAWMRTSGQLEQRATQIASAGEVLAGDPAATVAALGPSDLATDTDSDLEADTAAAPPGRAAFTHHEGDVLL